MTLRSPAGGDELSSPSRFYSMGTGRFTSMDPAKMDPMNPITGNPFVGMNGNPMIYIDVNGRVGWLTDVKNFFDGNVEHYQAMASAPGATQGDGVLAGVGMGASEIGAFAFRGLNYLSNVGADYAGRAAPGTFGGVQEQAQEDLVGTFQSAEAMGTAAANPRQTHERMVATTVAAMEGDPQATMMLTSTAVGLATLPMGRVAAPTVFVRGNQFANTVARPVKYFTAETMNRVSAFSADVRAATSSARVDSAFSRALDSEMQRSAYQRRSVEGTEPAVVTESSGIEISLETEARVDMEIAALRDIGAANRNPGRVQVASPSSNSLGYGADIRVDRVAQNLAFATIMAERILGAGKTLGLRGPEAYFEVVAKGASGKANYGTALQQVLDELTKSNRYLGASEANVLRNNADLRGLTNPSTGKALRPDYQAQLPGSNARPVLDLTTALEAADFRKTQKYQPPEAKQRTRINITYGN